ncbi:TSC complex subunit 1a isoform X2 [Archocentrus centrarchus]|uniref:TSC complex subunit 1a isoform X2 n=1 Tax=Archocentrus centrarchus TaxID=63155 RepID=UPI0011EA1D67|nr:hamartin-like isoform X2 [Archocentrus centrarchus]
MSREQVSVSELLLSLDSSELREAEQVRAAVNQQLSTDKGSTVLSSLVDFYLDSSSSQAALLLSSIREPHHKVLLEKLNESLGRPGTRLATLTLLGHLIRKQPPWIHLISRSALLSSLLRCLKTDGDVLILITGVLVLVTLLPMIPQAGKQHINDFFDVFGRLTSRSCKNPGHVPMVYMVHLHAGVYSLFHRLYGMFPCNFISYLRLHYSMKENLDTFQEVVKPMLDHVRVHPELVTGTQDYELDPSRWRCYEVHDIVIECSRVSLDPLESSCEEDSSSSSLLRPPPLSLLPHLDLTCSPQITDAVSSSDELTPTLPVQANDVTWSPAIQCGLSTPPLEQSALGSAHSLSRSTCVSGEKWPSSGSVPVSSLAEDKPGNSSHVRSGLQVKMLTDGEGSTFQPITEKDERGLYDVINSNSEDLNPEESQQPPPSSSSSSSQPRLFTSTPSRAFSASDFPPAPCFTPPRPSSEEGDPAHSDCSPALPYEPLFEFALPRAAMLFIEKKTQEVLEKKEGGVKGENREEGAATSVSPLKVLDQLIIHGHDAHVHLSRRLSAGNKSVDRSHFGGKQQSMKSKGPSQEEELQSLRNQLLLVHSQLQYERFKRQQHAIRNRRLLRRVINATALEEQSAAMKSQLGVQDDEIRSLRSSLDEEQRRYSVLQQETHTQNKQLHTHIAQLLQLHRDEQRESQRLQGELQECQNRLRDLEAELQKANNKAYNAEHLLTQLSLKLCSSEQLQQQMFLLNQQLVLLKETNGALREQLEGGGTQRCTEASMLQCSVGKEYLRLKDSDVQHRQKLEAANHRITELESQLVKKDQLLLNQKKLLEDTKNQNRAELSASDSRCAALRSVNLTLQTEMLHLYSQIHLDTHAGGGANPHGQRQDINSSDGDTLPDAQGSPESCPLSSSAVGIVNGAMEALSTSPISLSLSPIDSPLAVGSFLEQQARRLFGPTDQRQEEEEEEEEEEDQEEVVKVQSESPPLGQEVEEAMLLTGSPQTEPSRAAAPSVATADLTPAVQQRRHELSIMDYDEMLPDI